MSRQKKYQVSPELIRTYLSLIGAEKKLYNRANIEDISEEGVRNINELYDSSLSEDISILPQSSWRVADRLGTILEGASSAKGQFNVNNVLYQHAILSIMEKITNLNLIEEDSEDYILHFERINSIYDVALDQMLSLSQEEVIRLNEIILDLDKTIVMKLAKNQKFVVLICLLFLATRSDENIKDYEMFEKGTAKIDYEKMVKLVCENFSSPNLFDTSLFNAKSGKKNYEAQKTESPKPSLNFNHRPLQERHPELFSGERQSYLNAYRNGKKH